MAGRKGTEIDRMFLFDDVEHLRARIHRGMCARCKRSLPPKRHPAAFDMTGAPTGILAPQARAAHHGLRDPQFTGDDVPLLLRTQGPHQGQRSHRAVRQRAPSNPTPRHAPLTSAHQV